MNVSLKKFAVATALTLLAASAAQATVVFTVTRQSDQLAIITGSGTLDGVQANNNQNFFSIEGLLTGLGQYGNQNVFVSSTMKVGSVAIDFASDAGPGFTGQNLHGLATVYAGNVANYSPFQLGATVSGQLVLATTGAVKFAPVGTIGDVEWGINGNLHSVGTLEIVAASSNVPEPASLALIGGGLLAVGAARRSRRRG